MKTKGGKSAQAEARRDRIAELTRQGLTARAIAEILHCTPRTVCRARAARGCSQEIVPRLSEDEKLRAKKLLEDGASYAEVSRTIGRNRMSVERHFPGYTWSRSECAEYASLARDASRILRGTQE